MTSIQPMMKFGDKLRLLEKTLEQENVLTDDEIVCIVKQIKETAMKAVRERQKHVTFYLDYFRSDDKPQLARASSVYLEKALQAEGLSATYHKVLLCGAFCDKRGCPQNTHWGYIISWPQPKK